MANILCVCSKTKGDSVGSIYVLKDESKDVELLDVPGRTAREIFELIDSEDTDCADVAIFDWEYHGFSADSPVPVYLDAETVEADMMTLIGVFFVLAPDRKFGAATVLEWIDGFERIARHVRAHPTSAFRSYFFE